MPGWRMVLAAVAIALSVGAAGCEKDRPLETVPASVLGPAVPDANADAGPTQTAEHRAEKRSGPEVISSYALEGHRIEGETQILPSEKVKRAMALAGREKVVSVVRMCLDKQGDVSRLEILSSSGFRSYDEQILGAMSHWKYRPHMVAGEPKPICTNIQFVYEQQPAQVAGGASQEREAPRSKTP